MYVHYHNGHAVPYDDECPECPPPYTEENEPEYRSDHSEIRVVLWGLFVCFLIIIFVWLMGNYITEGNVPASCQVLGGHWTVFSGWTCN
jgi:hypothetical protein